MSSPSPSNKSNGSHKRRKGTRSRSASGSTASDVEKPPGEGTSTSNAPGQMPSENENQKVAGIHTEPAETNPSQPPQPSARSSNVEGAQTGVTPSSHGSPSLTQPVSGNQEVPTEIPTHKEGSPNQDDRVQRVQIEPERKGWARLADLVRSHDKERIEDVKEDIDTLLVFAGLFSAVITAFIIESYKTLQLQPEDTTNQILQQMSLQLASLSISGGFVNLTTRPYTSPTVAVPRFAVATNTLRSLSLVLALITASLAILVKQWFHEFLASTTRDPRGQVKLRFFRDIGMKNWQVFELAAFLPLLLQLALLLFFVGFGLFLYDLNHIVAWITIGAMFVWFAIFLFTTIAPAFSSQCPYKTPILRGILRRARHFAHAWPMHTIDKLHNLAWRLDYSCWTRGIYNRTNAWVEGRKASEEESVSEGRAFDLATLLSSQDVLRGERLAVTMQECIEDYEGSFSQKDIRGLRIDGAPSVYNGAKNAMAAAIHQVVFHNHHPVLRLSEVNHPYVFHHLYEGISFTLSELYIPNNSHPIPAATLPRFIQLIEDGLMSATFAILTMYSIRLRTMTKHPNKFDNLFQYLSYSEMHSYGVGDQFISNLLVATKTLIHSLWNRQQPESHIQQIADCVAAIRDDAGYSDPAVIPDPIAFIYVFAIVLNRLTPLAVVRKHRERIFEVMDELAEILTDLDVSSWSYSRTECAEWASRHLYYCDLWDEQNLCPKLRTLIKTWNPAWPW